MGYGDNHKIETHESYGQALFTRRSGGSGQHYGSSINTFHNIGLTIVRSECIRDDLHSTRYHGREVLIEVEMTPNQFADLITCMGCGSGVPVTIQEIGGRQIKYEPHTTTRQEFVNEFKRDMKKITESMVSIVGEIEEIFDKPSVNKADRKDVLAKVVRLVNEIRQGLPFMHDQFNESMDKTIVEAKSEIEGFFNTTIHRMGLEGLQAEMAEKMLGYQKPTIIELDDKGIDP